ncbi:glycosyltransferase [Phycisphaera mikurensis]|uniref:Putative glycosyltransferase n=1 Tax=Phycisphaera mikurensis (strain NBRC 102666 / KCTC 22515 / FYK2301M01) TaxID=1142394 RepID=I0IAY6_PHYMF|nr:glycosyltransferase [Phycisphaera mikurensis]MBB6442604.1 glycosyltransferase involved in cell wall biosynthesis [Phycisphaera mikurensis]BAM02424.1 putative glycosyltransferase [Phycisphaera mikurensis NBRC 102666]
MKLVIHLHRLYAGGIERAMGNLAGGLMDRGHEVRLVLDRDGFTEAFRFFPEGIDVHRTGATSLPGRVLGLRRTLGAQPADCVLASQHVNCELSVIGSQLAGTACIPIEHTNWSTSLAELGPLSPRRYSHRACRLVYPLAAARAAVSAGVADDYAQLSGLPREGFTVVYNAVVTAAELAAWRSGGADDAPPAGDALHRFFREPGGPVVLGMGRVGVQKDFPLLLEAFAQLEHTPAPRLVIFGLGAGMDELWAQARRLGIDDRFDLPGFTADALGNLRAADLFALSSRYEGLPTVLIEALAVGTPVVSTDCPSGPREILDGGTHGRLVPVGEAAPLAAAMDAALADAAAGRHASTPLSWLERFSVESVAETYERMIEKALA